MKIETKNVKYSYDGEKVFDGVNISVETGERVVFLGPNGSGKTTLLKILSGLYEPDEGKIYIDGEEKKSSPSFNFLVGFVPESPEEMFFEETVEREIEYILKNKGVEDSERKEAIDRELKRFNIEHLRDRNPFNLSSGQRKKVSIASVVVAEQPFIFLDEPISGLDREGVREVEEWLNLTSENECVAASTHRTDFAKAFDRVVLMNGGEIINKDCDLTNHDLLKSTNIFSLRRE